MALKYASHGYILENGRVVMDGEARALAANEGVKEFYLGVAGEKRKSFRDVKHYKRLKRWLVSGADEWMVYRLPATEFEFNPV
jgi:branched-chain amino acid transport system ATP-binding protein